MMLSLQICLTAIIALIVTGIGTSIYWEHEKNFYGVTCVDKALMSAMGLEVVVIISSVVAWIWGV